ncbi:MAG TPA: alpha-galactosidase [Bryobacteraceae bacterium]|nr:alpha-galactosidase [Bryobacteraceae bacterium]
MRSRLCWLFLVLSSIPPLCAQSIQFVADRKIWLLSTRQSSYAMGVSAEGSLEHLYWGAPLWRASDLPAAPARRDISSFDPRQMLENEEYPGWGGPRYYEPALKIAREDGNRDLVLTYVSHRIENDTLDISLKDIRDAIEVTLHYRVYPDYGVIARSATIRNSTNRALTVDSAQSATWHMPPGDGYQLSYLTGRWAAETQLTREPVHQGMKVLESRKGHTSHNINPWFAIDEGAADEEHGRVWFGALAWSGNWRITVEQTPYKQVRITGGLNTFDFAYRLKPGESLDTPEFLAGFSADGFGGASRLLHRFEREKILPGGASSRLRPVLYNSWEATTFNVSEAGQKQLADKAAKLGVELFVIDDGWFGKRNNDRAGLGDWFVNPQKFPQGLEPLIDYVNGLGMDFGLWVEPEMVNADSDLYRAHPDWVVNFPGRPRSELRNQMILNLARNDVREYIFGVLDKLASEHNIRYFKWDMNRSFSEPGWPEVEPADQRKLWVEYVRNLYDILDRLRARHPKLEIESCSGGGGRVDLGILRRVEEVWASDNTEAFDRLRIQEGFSQAYAPKVMSAWVTDVPNMNQRSTPLQYRFLVAMQGALGIGANLNRWTDTDTATATKMVALYKRIRATVQAGDLHRLFSPRTGDLTANEYVASDGRQAVVFAFRHSQEYNTAPPAIHLRGLEERAVYRVESIDGKLVERQPELSGAYLMRAGLNVNLRGDFDSTAVILERVN